MAEKRMFTQKIIDSDAFLDMPLSAQALYFHLNMRADDDGFVNNPKRVTKLVNASDDDLKILLMKRFVIGFESGVIVIKHWRMHNTLRSDRYRPTDYQEELAQLRIKPNKAYTDHPEKQLPASESPQNEDLSPSVDQMATTWQPNGNQMAPQNREGLGLDKGLDIDEDINTSIQTKEIVLVDAEPCSADAEPAGDSVELTIILNDGTEHPVTREYVDQMQQLFPAVDVRQQLLKMKAWSINNPSRRKTKRGITAFINNWLSKEQDRGSAPAYPPPRQKPGRMDALMKSIQEDLQNERRGD